MKKRKGNEKKWNRSLPRRWKRDRSILNKLRKIKFKLELVSIDSIRNWKRSSMRSKFSIKTKKENKNFKK